MNDVEESGDPRVDAVTARLRGVEELAIEEHVRVYEEAHEDLRAVLASLDAAQGGG